MEIVDVGEVYYLDLGSVPVEVKVLGVIDGQVYCKHLSSSEGKTSLWPEKEFLKYASRARN